MAHWLDLLGRFVLSCQVALWFLPPVETFAAFPRFQDAYEILIALLKHWGTLDLRGLIYSGTIRKSLTAAPAAPELPSPPKDA